MVRICCIRLLVVLLALVTQGHARDLPSAPASAAQGTIDQARAAIDKQDWAGARTRLTDALAEDPASADVHNLLGYVYRKQPERDLAKAFVHYRLALGFDPRHRGAHEYIGEAYLQDDRLADAMRHLEALETICGNRTCEEYADLSAAIARYRASRK